MLDQLREKCRRLLQDGVVQVVIGYGQSSSDGPTFPVFVTSPDDVEQLVWNDRCFANLTTYLRRKEVRALGKPAIVVKGCDARTLSVLERESQIDRNEMVVIGMKCDGQGKPPLAKCSACDVHTPRRVDHLIPEGTPEDASAASSEARYADLEEFMKKTPEERLAYWREELSRCVKCYACRQTCPLCYCEKCLVEKNRPQAIVSSPSTKGNFAYHIARAFHQAGRCVGCDECTRICPAGINLRLLNQSLARAAETNFGFRSGEDPNADPLIGVFSEQDKENFIR